MRAVAAAIVIVASASALAAVEDDLRDGDKYFEQGDWKKAASAYDRAIGKAPGQVSAEAYGKRAAIFIILKDMKGGLDFIAKAKRQYPNAPEVQEQEALLLWETDRKDDAIKIAEKVVQARPQAFSNQKIIGEYFAGRDPERAATAFEQYLANRPSELESGDVLPRIRLGFAYLANARAALGDGDDSKALALYGKAVDQLEIVERKFAKKANAQVNVDNGLCAAYVGMEKWDQATTVCERIVADPRRVDSQASAWYHLGTAYLENHQPKKARTAADQYVRARRNEARGQVLLGDTYFAERDWAHALDHYLSAEKLLRPNEAREQIQISIQLGKTYRRLPAPPTGPNTNLDKAIEKLTIAQKMNPKSVELAIELGGAYLEAKQDGKAGALADKLAEGTEKSPEARAALLVIAGKALYNEHKLRDARQRFEAAQQLRPADIQIRRELVETIDEQAFEVIGDHSLGPKAAQALLEQALAVDPQAPATLTNLAVLALDRGDCDGALRSLARLREMRGADVVLVARLSGRAYLCSSHPDPKAAGMSFALGEKEAKNANAQLALAEIYTEWAPLLWDADLAQAVDKLELAVQIAGQDPDVGPAARRNLALALYRRGWKQMQQGKTAEAASDFERATRDSTVLKGSEPYAFDFSYAVALLDTGRSQEAVKLFKALAARGNQSAYLKGPYARVGTPFFAAYAGYRTATGAGRQAACADLGRLEGEVGGRAKELVASCWEMVAFDEWRAGNAGAAGKALVTAEKTASADQKRRLGLDRAALALGKDKLAELEALAGNPPESLVDLGIVYDLIGRPKEAYETWQRAKAHGVTTRDLQKWIDAKRRIYGY